MVLRMNHPWKHPDSGIYWYRKRVPERLKPLVGKTEVKISLRTRSPDEAKIEFARISLEVEERWRMLSAGIRSLTERQAVGIAGEIYRSMVEEHEDNPSRVSILHLMLDNAVLRPGSVKIYPMGMKPDLTRAAIERMFERRIEDNARKVDDWLKAQGLLLDPDSRKLVGTAVDNAILDARKYLERMANGDYSPDPAASRFPQLELKPEERSVKSGKGLTFDAIIDAEAQRRGAGKRSKPMPLSSIKKFKRIAKEFSLFRKSNNAATTTLAEVEEWSDFMMKAAVLDNRTIADKLTCLGTIINWGKSLKQYREPMASAELISV